jgi:hypothetical protein
MEANQHVEDRSAVLDRNDSSYRKASAATDAINLLQNRHRRAARA